MLKIDDSLSRGPAIAAHELRKSFRGPHGTSVQAVRGVDLAIAHAEIFGFLGPNGAGKTTTLRMLTTLVGIDAGEATVAGLNVARSPDAVRRRIGYVSQLGGADDLATGRENLLLQGRLYGGDLATVRRRADALIELLDLAEFADRRAATYSGGQRRRLDIALGIIHEPQVLFLDEPSTGLDPQNRAALWDHVRALRERGTTVFLTTHYLEEADALCDRLTIIDHGRIVTTGSADELKRDVGGDTIAIELRDADAARRAADELRPHRGVRDVRIDGARLRVVDADGGAVLPELLRTLDREAVALSSIAMSEPTLDDVFLDHTGRSLRDGSSSALVEPDPTAVAA